MAEVDSLGEPYTAVWSLFTGALIKSCRRQIYFVLLSVDQTTQC